MRILITCTHYPVASGRYMADAFRRLGHDVRTQGGAEENNIWGLKIDPKYIWTPSREHTAEWADLIIVMDSDPAVWGMTEHLVKTIPYTCPVVVYGVDNHVRSYENDLFQHYFLAHYHGPTYPINPARKDHSWLPCASDPMFTPSPIAWEDREFDVACVGVMYPRRQKLVEMMKDAGLKVFTATGLLYEEYRAAYHNARISLCVSAAGDVAQRIFETGRMGCAVLTDPLLDIMDEQTGHDLGLRGFAVYWSDAEAVTIAKTMLLGEPAFQVAQHSNDIMPKAKDAPMIPLGLGSAIGMAASCKAHTWDARAQVIVDWYEREYGKDTELNNSAGITAAEAVETVNQIRDKLNERIDVPLPEKVELVLPARKPYLNLGCGRTHFPSEPPSGHELVEASIYAYPDWLNVDKVEGVGADLVFDLFAYPWPLEDNSFDGAVLGHIVEHIPGEIKVIEPDWDGFNDPVEFMQAFQQYKRNEREAHRKYQNGWFAFFAELYRVLTPGASAHVICPYGWCDSAIIDPTHTRYLTVQSFLHGLAPSQYTGTFQYNVDCNFEVGNNAMRYTEMARPFQNDTDLLQNAIMTRLNMAYDFYVQLKVVK